MKWMNSEIRTQQFIQHKNTQIKYKYILVSQFTIIIKCIQNNMFLCINLHGLRPGDCTKAIQTAGRQPPSIIFCVLIF